MQPVHGAWRKPRTAGLVLCALNVWLLIWCTACAGPGRTGGPSVPRSGKWGIYALDLMTKRVGLIYGSDQELFTSALRLNSRGDRLVFSQKLDGTDEEDLEICTVGVDGSGYRRLTDNDRWDLYPAWSPDGARIVFLSFAGETLDLYVMNADGSEASLLFDSGGHDADPHWVAGIIVFTSGHAIWAIDGDGTNPRKITSPPGAGTWGQANLPVGDYDPRLSPDGTRVVFERLVDPGTVHGGYDIYVTGLDGTGERRLSTTTCAQGLASWSHAGDKLAYVVAAIGAQGQYDIYVMDADGRNNRNVTPSYFPPSFLCHSPVFSKNDTTIYFIGQWWD